jgi:hypothetical protein
LTADPNNVDAMVGLANSLTVLAQELGRKKKRSTDEKDRLLIFQQQQELNERASQLYAKVKGIHSLLILPLKWRKKRRVELTFLFFRRWN